MALINNNQNKKISNPSDSDSDTLADYILIQRTDLGKKQTAVQISLYKVNPEYNEKAEVLVDKWLPTINTHGPHLVGILEGDTEVAEHLYNCHVFAKDFLESKGASFEIIQLKITQ